MKDQLLKGTMILTIAGFATRVIGFCYRIFLAGELGEVNLGIYQLIFSGLFDLFYNLCRWHPDSCITVDIASAPKKSWTNYKSRYYTFSLSGSHFVV